MGVDGGTDLQDEQEKEDCSHVSMKLGHILLYVFKYMPKWIILQVLVDRFGHPFYYKHS